MTKLRDSLEWVAAMFCAVALSIFLAQLPGCLAGEKCMSDCAELFAHTHPTAADHTACVETCKRAHRLF